MTETLLNVNDLRKGYATPAGMVYALNGVSFSLDVAETLAIVGESGCGKSTLASSLIRLIEPDSGSIKFDGLELIQADAKSLAEARRKIGFVFQNPYSSLNPKMRVVDIIGEPLKTVKKMRGKKLLEKVGELLTEVGLGAEHLKRFPHQFSGGQRQRIAIARALALEPSLVILDEPTAALDVSVQAQILDLLIDIQLRSGVSYIFISHDLAVVEYIADRIMVMYMGRAVEIGNVADILPYAAHPYTQALIKSVPTPDPNFKNELQTMSGEVPSALNPAPGCAFAPRCVWAKAICNETRPEFSNTTINRDVACHMPLVQNHVEST